MADFDKQLAPWRVGRKVGRTIYAQFRDRPSNLDPLIGTLDTPELAKRAVEDHNASLATRAPEQLLDEARELRGLLSRAYEVIRRGEIRIDADCSPESPLARQIKAALAAASPNPMDGEGRR